jgi:gliding motility-associated lipoprotein GldH
MIRSKSILIFICLLWLTACGNRHVYDHFEAIKDYQWGFKEAKQFVVPIANTTKKYNVFLNIRHTEDYAFNNLWIMFSQRSPDGKERAERRSLSLADPSSGRWFGSGNGEIYDDQFVIMKNVTFTEAGSYTYNIRHVMRNDEIDGIMDIGLRVEEVME